jgi:hypothetical protein
MKWSNIKFALEKLSKDQLEQEARIFNPRYGREFLVTTLCERAALPTKEKETGHVLIVSPDASG